MSVVAPVTIGVAYFCVAAASLHLTQGIHGIATIWPASGVLLAAMLRAPRSMILWLAAAAAVASVAANLTSGCTLETAAVLTTANISEALLAWWLLRGRGQDVPTFVAPAEIGRFCAVSLAAATTSAAIATIGTMPGSVSFMTSWFLTDLLGMMIVTPILLMSAAVWQRWTRHGEAPYRAGDAMLLLPLLAVVTIGVFSQSTYPLLFLPLVALIAATHRLGPFGAAGGVLLIMVIATTMTATGHGPMLLLHGQAVTVPLFLQFYLLVLLGTASPLAASLATRNRLLRQVAESNRLLMLAERTAQVGHWRLDAKTKTVFWSPEIFRLHGLPDDRTPSLEAAIDAYHPDDRAMVTAKIALAMECEGDGEFMFEARLVRPDGEVRHIVSRGHADRTSSGRLLGLFGVLQDVSERVRASQALEAARNAAEVAADTDQLTGLASRRRALRTLDAAIIEARSSGQALSVAIFDVDHFKVVNDRFGHLAGDQVLQRIARAAADASRRGDLVGRLGGEEFVMVLPGADKIAAAAVAERVRLAIGDAGGEEDDTPRVTISIGVAGLDADASATMLLNRADTALYEAKRSGRNRMRLAA